MSHIEKRRQLWYATLKVVSQQAQERLGKKKFLKSLGTGDKRKALELAKPLVAMWKAMIREAEGEPDAVRSEALRWREVLAVMRGTHDGEDVADAEMLVTARAEAIEQTKGEAAAVEFAQVALGARTLSDSHYKEWLGSIVHLSDEPRARFTPLPPRVSQRDDPGGAALEDVCPHHRIVPFMKWFQKREGASRGSRRQ